MNLCKMVTHKIAYLDMLIGQIDGLPEDINPQRIGRCWPKEQLTRINQVLESQPDILNTKPRK